ncbi:DHS-like NAD/FAD-binding domain-containing protein [Multifurca ochricompacta]|uniref:DHS-like NAD/FAD-binding domain-containing protein n=1 Tax=Multifurca ochricompacta TaxID=376703 RepID=A0AAD4M726_9AGAM|nr:DHS-like NAD/FAD-binding domain-containing protein [Multifurca ochricompacta]
MSAALPSTDMAAFKELLSSSKHIIAVAGAGLSAGSGISTFRESGGMWRKYNGISLTSYGAFKSNPSRIWQFYHCRREKASAANPNAAHIAIAKFSVESIRKQIAPEATFTLITQNVDGLSTRALMKVQDTLPVSGSRPSPQPQLLEMHGRLFDVLCTSETCGHCEPVPNSPVCAALWGTEDLVENNVIEPTIDEADLPRCAKCGALARPGVVWFGEAPHHLQIIHKLVAQANLCLVVGTSLTTWPAASYGRAVQRHGGKVAVFNLERTNGDEGADFLFLGPCEETIPEALGF